MDASKKTKKEFVEKTEAVRLRPKELKYSKAERQKAEEALKESEEHARIFASYQHAVSELRQFYATEASFEQMLQKTVDLFVKDFGYYMTWYGELKVSEKVIIPRVWAGKYEKYLDGLRLELDDSKDAKCAMSLAIVRKKPFGYANLEHDKDFEKWRPLALKYGYRSNQAVPLIIGGESIGAFLIYSTRPGAFSEILIQYLEGIANELATIIEKITERKEAEEQLGKYRKHLEEMVEKRTTELKATNEQLRREVNERKQAEETLRESEEKYRQLVSTTTDAIMLFDAETRKFIDVNNACEGLYGYSREEFLCLKHGDITCEPEKSEDSINKALKGDLKKIPLRYHKKKDGTVFPVEISASTFELEGRKVLCDVIRDITERKQADETLIEAKEHTERVIEGMLEAVTIMDLDGTIRQVNSEFEKGTGWKRQEAVGKTAIELGIMSKEEGHRIEKEIIPELMNEGFVRNIETTVIRRDGTKFPALMCWTLMKDAEGKPTGIIVVATDITELKRAEEKIRIFADAIAEAIDAIAITDMKGIITYANPAKEKIYGYKKEELIGKHVSSFNPKPEMVEEMISTLMKTGSWKGEVLQQKKNKEIFPVLLSLSTIKDEKGSPIAMMGAGRDITKRKKAEETLRKNEEKYRSLVINIPDVTWTADDKGNTVFISPNIEKVYGYTPEEIYKEGDRLWFGRVHPDDVKELKEVYKALFEKGIQFDTEYRMKKKDGEWIWLHDRSIVTYEKDGVMYADGIFSDITEHKRSEEKLLNYQKQLQLLASKLSVTEEHEKHRLATELHDHIAQPLVFSKMKLDKYWPSMASTDLGKSLKEISNTLEQVIDGTQNLTYDLGSPTLYELGLEAAIKEWLTEEIEAKHNITTVFEDDGALKPLSDDISAFVLRAVRELTVNVVKHAQAHNLKVSLQREADKIIICVTDDGIGFKLSDTGLPKDKGSGYGIFSIKERLSHIGGDLDVKSEPGHGTQVVLRVPLVEKDTITGD